MHGATLEGRTPVYEPGIEVVQAECHPNPIPQASPDVSQNDKYATEPTYRQHDEGIHWHKGEGQQSYAIVGEDQGSHAHVGNTKSTGKRKKWIALAIGALIVIIAGAAAGGVLGSRAKQAQDEAPEYAASPNIWKSLIENQSRTEKSPETSEEMFGSPTSVFPGLAPTAVSWTSKHLEVWALTRDTTHSVYRKWQNESYPDGYPKGTEMELAGDGVPINATKTPSIALVKRTEGRTAENYRVDVHVVSPGGQGTLTWHSPSQRLRPAVPRTPWFVFESLKSIQVQSAIVSVGYAKEGDKMTSMFLSSSGNKTAVWYTHLRGYDTWDPPGLIKGPDLYGWATPAVVAWNEDPSRHDVIAVSTDSHLLHSFSDDRLSQWSGYEDLGGFITTPPTVVSRTPGFLDVFVRGGDGGLWQISLENEKTWSGWRRISGTTRIQGQPHAVSSRFNSIDVFAWGEGGGAMLYKTYDSVERKWTPSDDKFITLMPSGLVGPPKGVVVGEEVYVFAYNDQNNIVWQTIGPDKTAKGEARIWAKVPADVS